VQGRNLDRGVRATRVIASRGDQTLLKEPYVAYPRPCLFISEKRKSLVKKKEEVFGYSGDSELPNRTQTQNEIQ
jgi:hypothetical protein